MEGKFDVIYINHPDNNHDELAEENNSKRENFKSGRSHRIRDDENSTVNSVIGKILTLSL